jgi:hypothetical protein
VPDRNLNFGGDIMKRKFFYSYHVMRGTPGYSHPTITVYEPGSNGEFDNYRDIGEFAGQCNDADHRYNEPAKTIPYALRADVKLQWGNAVLMAKILSDLTKLGPWGIEYRALVKYLKKNGERMHYDKGTREYTPAKYRRSADLWKQAQKRGLELKRAV